MALLALFDQTLIQNEKDLKDSYDKFISSIPTGEEFNALVAVSEFVSKMNLSISILGVIHKKYIDSILLTQEMPMEKNKEDFKQWLGYKELTTIEMKAIASMSQITTLEEKLFAIWPKESLENGGLLRLFPPSITTGFLQQLLYLARETTQKGMGLKEISGQLTETIMINKRSSTFGNRRRKEHYLFITDIKEVKEAMLMVKGNTIKPRLKSSIYLALLMLLARIRYITAVYLYLIDTNTKKDWAEILTLNSE